LYAVKILNKNYINPEGTIKNSIKPNTNVI